MSNDVLDALRAAMPHLARAPGKAADEIYKRAEAAIAAAVAAPAPILAIVLESGMVSDIVSNRPDFFAGVDVLSVDYDVHHEETSSVLVPVRQGDGTIEKAYVHDEAVDRAKIDLPGLVAALAEFDALETEG